MTFRLLSTFFAIVMAAHLCVACGGTGNESGSGALNSDLSAKPALDFDGDPGRPTVTPAALCYRAVENGVPQVGTQEYRNASVSCRPTCVAYFDLPGPGINKDMILDSIAALCAEEPNGESVCYAVFDTACPAFVTMDDGQTSF